MEKNYTKSGLLAQIKDHEYNNMTNGHFSKRLSKKTKKQLLERLNEMNDLLKKAQNGDKSPVKSSEQESKLELKPEETQSPTTDEEPEQEEQQLPIINEKEEVKQVKFQKEPELEELLLAESEPDEEFHEEIKPVKPVKKNRNYLKERKKKKENKKKLVDKIKQMELDKEYKILDEFEISKSIPENPSKFTKKKASLEIKFLKEQIKKLINDELSFVNKEIKRYNKSGIVYPFCDKRDGLLNVLEDLVEQLNLEINDLLNKTKFKDYEDQTRYEEYIFDNVRKYILSIENKIDNLFN